MSEKIYIKRETANALVYGDEEGFKRICTVQIGTRRWEADFLLVIQRLSDGKLFGAVYSEGLTELQERCPFEDYDANENDEIEFKECIAKEKRIVEYVYA